jgi:hypothetical protein
MNPTAALMLSEAIEEERRRVLRHPRRWTNDERPAKATKASGILHLPRVFRLADSKA